MKNINCFYISGIVAIISVTAVIITRDICTAKMAIAAANRNMDFSYIPIK